MGTTQSNEEKLLHVATRSAELLRKNSLKVVFAESCTAGLIAATFSKIPGISATLCGSFVTYRNDSKHHWLNVNSDDLESPKIGPVSETVAEQMSVGALQSTPEADVAVSVTGHLGPNAPAEFDGLAYSAIQFRKNSATADRKSSVTRLELDHPSSITQENEQTLRVFRQQVAVCRVLESLELALKIN